MPRLVAFLDDMTDRLDVSTGARVILCPQCQHPLPSDARTCPHCGVDLALLSLLGEKAYLEGYPEAAPIAGTPAWMVPRIGDYLIEQGLLSKDKLSEALQRQSEFARQGKQVLLGQTLIQMGLLDRETIDRALTRQIVELHAALQESNRTLERRVAERTAELRRALERLTDINQIKANLISNVSHELRTPLAHIKGYIELLAEGQLGELTEEQQKAIAVVLRAGDRLGRLIEDLIEFSTASREGMNLRLGHAEMPALLEEVRARSAAKAERAGVDLSCKIEGEIPLLNIDAERLSWAVFQLVDNAIKFTPDGGKVTVSAGMEDEQVRVAVSDTGIGIPSERREEILEPFHQLDGSATRRYGGTGLGLALVKIILDAHGAPLEIESTQGEGSTFRFVLPSSLRVR